MIKKIDSKILSKKFLSDNVAQFILSVPKDFDFKPGQYVLLELKINNQIIRRAYSIASSPGNNKIELIVKKIVSNGFANEMFKLKKNSQISFLGPAGKFFIDKKPSKPLVFISVGTGIAPFKSMIEYILKNQKLKKEIILIHGYRTEKDVLYKNYFTKLSKEFPNFKQYIVLSKPKKANSKIFKGYVQDFINDLVQNPKDKSFYLCGMKNMIEEVSQKLHSMKIPSGNIFFEKYD